MNEVTPEPTESTDHEPAEAAHTQAGRRIEYLSLAWTSLEAIGGLIAGLMAGSIALIGFGADSVIEIASSSILLWRLSDHALGNQREDTALKLVGVSFLVLAAYIAFESVESLLRHQAPRVSYFGIGFSVLCLVVMPLLARAKRRSPLSRWLAAKRRPGIFDSHRRLPYYRRPPPP